VAVKQLCVYLSAGLKVYGLSPAVICCYLGVVRDDRLEQQ